MTTNQIMDMQRKIGAEPDGFWGRKSIAACQKHLRALMPSPHPFPKAGTKAFDDFYGPHGEPDGYSPPTKKIKLPFTIYYDGTPVSSLSPHEKCADRMLAAFERLAIVFPTKTARADAGILIYDGLYNPRKMRGSRTSWSMHSWACAIDLNASKNGNTTHWPTKATMSLEVMECFAQEGFLGLGWAIGRDAMHFQATQ